MARNYSDRAGKYFSLFEEYDYFIPKSLPPVPPLEQDDSMQLLISEAHIALGGLGSICGLIPNPDFFVGMFSRQEAVTSSQIEGTQATLSDLLKYEIESDRRKSKSDVSEVVNYLNAMRLGLDEMMSIPLSSRLIRDIHRVLLTGVRGEKNTPGEFRKHQVHVVGESIRISDARYVPPPHGEIPGLMADLEEFLHNNDPIPVLLLCGLVHAQFEMIHPFADGNGRIGRLLITLILCWKKALKQPLLYVSNYFNENKDEYCDCLRAVSDEGDWERWITFFLKGVKTAANDATNTAQEILALKEKHRKQINDELRSSAAALLLLDGLFLTPVLDLKTAIKYSRMSKSTTNNLLKTFQDLGILEIVTDRSRNRLYGYMKLINLFG